jgi:hypothetical protein
VNRFTRYVASHWRGDQGLARSCLINGLLGYLVTSVAVLVFGWVLAPIGTELATIAGLTLYFAWLGWASVGIVRCASRRLLSRREPLVRRSMAVIAMLEVLIFWILAIFGILTSIDG